MLFSARAHCIGKFPASIGDELIAKRLQLSLVTPKSIIYINSNKDFHRLISTHQKSTVC